MPGVHTALSASVVVIDDDVEITDLVSRELTQEGYAVQSANSGEDGLRLLEEHQVAVVIVDLGLPGLGGADVCRKLREGDRFAKTRILILSASEDTRQIAAGCDADGAIVKPFTLDLLKHEVRRLAGP